MKKPERQVVSTPATQAEVAFELDRELTKCVERAQAVLAKGAEQLVGGQAFYALEWGDKLYAAAAEMHLLKYIAETKDRGGWAAVVALRGHLTEEVMRKAASPERSTSPSHNYAHQCLTAAYAEFCGNNFGSGLSRYWLAVWERAPVDAAAAEVARAAEQAKADQLYADQLAEFETLRAQKKAAKKSV